MAIVLESIKGYIEGEDGWQNLTKITNTSTGMDGVVRVHIVQLNGKRGDQDSDPYLFDRVEREGQGGDLPLYRRNGQRYMQEGFLVAILGLHYKTSNGMSY